MRRVAGARLPADGAPVCAAARETSQRRHRGSPARQRRQRAQPPSIRWLLKASLTPSLVPRDKQQWYRCKVDGEDILIIINNVLIEFRDAENTLASTCSRKMPIFGGDRTVHIARVSSFAPLRMFRVSAMGTQARSRRAHPKQSIGIDRGRRSTGEADGQRAS
jgi:hypothetical protein